MLFYDEYCIARFDTLSELGSIPFTEIRREKHLENDVRISYDEGYAVAIYRLIGSRYERIYIASAEKDGY